LTYKEFYERYEDLNSTASKKRFKWHEENNSDFEEMAKACVSESWPDATDSVRLFGDTIFFMKLPGKL